LLLQNRELRQVINQLFRVYQPSKHQFWNNLMAAPDGVFMDKTKNGFLAHLYLAYQGAMHATRVAVYASPGIKDPEQRQEFMTVIVDDDSILGKSHHQYLHDMAVNSWGIVPDAPKCFNELPDLAKWMDKELPCPSDLLAPRPSNFVRNVHHLCM
jgi:hypothetical protein